VIRSLSGGGKEGAAEGTNLDEAADDRMFQIGVPFAIRT
jgi:hypothetical protein